MEEPGKQPGYLLAPPGLTAAAWVVENNGGSRHAAENAVARAMERITLHESQLDAGATPAAARAAVATAADEAQRAGHAAGWRDEPPAAEEEEAGGEASSGEEYQEEEVAEDTGERARLWLWCCALLAGHRTACRAVRRGRCSAALPPHACVFSFVQPTRHATHR